MKKKIKENAIDVITFICLAIMFLFAHGCEFWCTAITIASGMTALFLQNCVKYKERK